MHAVINKHNVPCLINTEDICREYVAQYGGVLVVWPEWKVGDVAMVFDSKLWAGKDAGSNAQFWKEATILNIYYLPPPTPEATGDMVADVRFHHDERTSRGHFISSIKRPKAKRKETT